jgi:hypothetical protein
MQTDALIVQPSPTSGNGPTAVTLRFVIGVDGAMSITHVRHRLNR